MYKVLITGGAGFIGSYLSNRLINENYSVDVIDNQLRGDYTRLDKRVKIYNIDFHITIIIGNWTIMPILLFSVWIFLFVGNLYLRGGCFVTNK